MFKKLSIFKNVHDMTISTIYLICTNGLDKRKLFILEYPALSDNTPEIDTSWWLETR